MKSTRWLFKGLLATPLWLPCYRLQHAQPCQEGTQQVCLYREAG